MLEFLLDNWVLVLAALTSGALLLWPQIRAGVGGPDQVSVSEAVRLINREKAVLVDVSEPAEFAAGHATGARNIPLGTLSKGGSIAGLPGNKGVPVVLICPRGARSAKAVGLVKKGGHEKVFTVTGGTDAWREAQLPTEKSAA